MYEIETVRGKGKGVVGRGWNDEMKTVSILRDEGKGVMGVGEGARGVYEMERGSVNQARVEV